MISNKSKCPSRASVEIRFQSIYGEQVYRISSSFICIYIDSYSRLGLIPVSFCIFITEFFAID